LEPRLENDTLRFHIVCSLYASRILAKLKAVIVGNQVSFDGGQHMISSFQLAVRRLRHLKDIYFNTGRVSAPYQTVTIETTAICNLDCPICPARKSDNIIERAGKQIKLADVQRIVDLTKHMTETYCLNIWGEPLLHKDFRKIVECVSEAGLPIWFSSNLNYSARLAEMLSEFPLLRIICSLDGWDTESYAEYRWGGKFDVVRRNLAILAAGKCKIYPQYLVTPDDENLERRKEQFLRFLEVEIGTASNVVFKRKNLAYRNEPGEVVPGRCSSFYGGLYFNCDGVLMPCCNNVRSDVFLNHISSYTSETLWNGEDVRNLRRSILKDKNQFDSCRSCAGEDYQQLMFAKVLVRLASEIFYLHHREHCDVR
jgi:pyruvate-formate lyase-activating enzyme